MANDAKTKGKAYPAGAVVEGRDHPLPPAEGIDFPAAGPHARDRLTDAEKTPGAGTLANPKKPRETDATGG